MFVIGNILFLLFPLSYVLNAPLWVFFITIAVGTFGHALTSGSLTPLIHESYVQSGASKRAYNVFLSRNTSSLFIARALSGVTGAWLFTISPVLPFIGWALSVVINIIVGLLIVEPGRPKYETSYHSHIIAAIKQIKASHMILVMLAAYIVTDLTAEAVWTGYQLFYEQDGRSAFVIGMLFSIIAILSAAGAHFVRKLYATFHPLSIMFIVSALLVLTSFLLKQDDTFVRMFAIVPMAIGSGFTTVTMVAVIQHIIPNKLQSTALSVNSLVFYGTYTIGSVLIGLVISRYGLNSARETLLISSLIGCSIVAALTMYVTRHSNFRLEGESDNA